MRYLKYISLTLLSLSLFVFMLLYPSLKLVGQPSFDITKWLDADLNILKRVFLPLFISGVLLLLIDVTYSNYQHQKLNNKQ